MPRGAALGRPHRCCISSRNFAQACGDAGREEFMKLALVTALLAALAPFALASAAEEPAVIVTATRFPENRLEAPVGMTIISSEEIARDTARTLPELLSRFVSIHARDNSGSPDQQIDLRGFGITGDQNTLVLLDGVRLNENDLSSTKLSAIPLQSIERIEILPGGGAVLFGGGASGGTINIITKSPIKDLAEITTRPTVRTTPTASRRKRQRWTADC
jgi:iron complex outermembrane receptor protein